MKVLLVEDNDSVRRIMLNDLEAHGYEVIECSDGRDAVRLAKAHNFDLILTDLNLPGFDGFELAGRFKGKPPLLLYTSGRSYPGLEELSKEYPLLGFITEASPEKIMKNLMELLSKAVNKNTDVTNNLLNIQ